MLNHPTVDKLHQLRLLGMARALAHQVQSPEIDQLSFDERLGLLVDSEAAERESRQNAARLKRAKLKQAATPEDVDLRHPRGLDRALFARLMSGQWVGAHQNVLICCPRKYYVMLYDSVPGGTGYLHQLLAHDAGTLADVLRMALDAVTNCACNADPEKDGCYRCLYQYRLGRSMEKVSRDNAKSVLTDLVGALDQLQRVETISDIFINPNFDSVLEARFIESLKRLSGVGGLPLVKLVQDVVNGKAGWVLEVGSQRYRIEPQCELGSMLNLSIWSKPDFVIWPWSATSKRKPIAVFCDGWTDHQHSMREALKLLRALIAHGPNDLFFVGDGHQRIYSRNRAAMSRCGIDIRGRSRKLYLNYRTTDEIRRQAVALLEGCEIDDLDDGHDESKRYKSLSHGPAPEVRKTTGLEEAAEATIAFFQQWRSVQAENESLSFCVVSYSEKSRDSLGQQLQSAGIASVPITAQSNHADARNVVHLATMHRAKGLEFDCVIVVAPESYLGPAEETAGQRRLLYVALTRAKRGALLLQV